MYLQYGKFLHPLNEAGVQQSKSADPGPRGVPPFIHERWTIRGEMTADNQVDLEKQMNAMIDAYSLDNQDIAILHDDGVTQSPMAVQSKNTITGIRISQPVFFPLYDGPEGGVVRTYNILAEWQTPNPDPNASLQDLTEQVTFSGTGGSRWVYQPTANGVPIPQQLQAVTTQHIYQVGRAVGLLAAPEANPPIYPAYEHLDERQIVPYRPTEMGQGGANWPITWSYHFELVPTGSAGSFYGGAANTNFGGAASPGFSADF